MTDRDLAQIESGLGVKLPAALRAFMRDRSEELKQAAKVLRNEVVLLTNPKSIVALNRRLRKDGIETGEDATPAPWPGEYLALSDNGAGDHECVRLTEKSGAVYWFDGEAGEFSRKFNSLDAYLDHLRKRLQKFQKSPQGRSDKRLLKRAPSLFADGRALKVPVDEVPPPLTVARARAAGIDVDRLKGEFAALLSSVTGIPPRRWAVRAVKGEYPNQLRLAYATKSKPARDVHFSDFQMIDAAMRLVVRTAGPHRPLDPAAIDWDAFHAAVRGLHEALMRTPLRMTAGKLKVEKPTAYGYVAVHVPYVIAPG